MADQTPPLPEAVRAPWDNELERCIDDYSESDDISVGYIRSLFVRVAEAAAQQERARHAECEQALLEAAMMALQECREFMPTTASETITALEAAIAKAERV